MHLQASEGLGDEPAEHGCAYEAFETLRVSAVWSEGEKNLSLCSFDLVAARNMRIMSICALTLHYANKSMQNGLLAHVDGLFKKGPAQITAGSFGSCDHLERFEDFADELRALV